MEDAKRRGQKSHVSSYFLSWLCANTLSGSEEECERSRNEEFKFQDLVSLVYASVGVCVCIRGMAEQQNQQ